MIEETKEELSEVPVSDLCELFRVSRSWYYQKPKAERQATEEVALRDAIERIVLEFPGYGYRRVTEALKRQGFLVNHKKVLLVMGLTRFHGPIRVKRSGSVEGGEEDG